jgi:hypothetical protein
VPGRRLKIVHDVAPPVTLSVERGVPLPPKSADRVIYPFGDMKIGDSFFAAGIAINRVSSAASLHGQRHGGRWTCRTVTEDGVRGTRCWRYE